MRIEKGGSFNSAAIIGPPGFTQASQLASNGSEFLLMGYIFEFCGSGAMRYSCREDRAAVRLDTDGIPIDSAPLVLNRNTPDFSIDIQYSRALDPGLQVFDGASYVLPFVVREYSAPWAPANVFLSRLATDGSFLDDDVEGLMLLPEFAPHAGPPRIAVDARHSVVVLATDDGEVGDVIAIPVLSHALDPAFAAMTIGTIGPLTIDEGGFLKLRLQAPTLNPTQTTFGATGLPDGARLEAATGLFSWRPDGTQAGIYNVRFEATDGAAVVTEDLTITVGEALLSISGTTRALADGSPIGGVSLMLTGLPRTPITAQSDADGRFVFDGLEAGGRYHLRLHRPSSREYLALPRAILVDNLDGDAVGRDLELSPR